MPHVQKTSKFGSIGRGETLLGYQRSSLFTESP
jgi:hypothetical protein